MSESEVVKIPLGSCVRLWFDEDDQVVGIAAEDESGLVTVRLDRVQLKAFAETILKGIAR